MAAEKLSETHSRPGKISRVQRRRLETRARLVTAAREIFAHKGPDAATIADITEAADVGLGTFYHHFASKEEALGAVVTDTAEVIGAALDVATAGITDPAEVMAACIRYVVRRATADPLWGWFILRSGTAPLAQAPTPLLRRNLRDLERGVQSGRFSLTDIMTAHAAVCGAVAGVIQARLLAAVGEQAAEHLAAQVLRLLGVPAPEADEIARRPLPDVAPEAARRRESA